MDTPSSLSISSSPYRGNKRGGSSLLNHLLAIDDVDALAGPCHLATL